MSPDDGDAALVAALKAGDEDAFREVVARYGGPMRRLALSFVRVPAVADEVVQEAWLGVLRGIDGFQELSSVRTWVYRILINKAKTRGVRDARTVPGLGVADDRDDGPTVDPARFRGADDPYPGHWRSSPAAWPSPEDGAVAAETRRQLTAALAGLPARQRVVVTLRDVAGHSSDEVCEMLSISAANQRVLLHRGRAALRAVLERHWIKEVTA